MNDKRLLERANNLAGGLVSRGYPISGFPFATSDAIPDDIICIVEGKMSDKEFEAKYQPRQFYQIVNLKVDDNGNVTGDSIPIDTYTPPKYLNPRCK